MLHGVQKSHAPALVGWVFCCATASARNPSSIHERGGRRRPLYREHVERVLMTEQKGRDSAGYLLP